MTHEQLKKAWLDAGGRFHGPYVETGCMPEETLLPFLAGLIETEREACAIAGGRAAEFMSDGTPRRWPDGQSVADAIRARSNVK